MAAREISKTVSVQLADMTLEQKIGQLLVLGFSGTAPHRDIIDIIRKYHVAGFRVTPSIRKFLRYLKPSSTGYTRVMRAPEPHERIYGAELLAPRVSAKRYAEVLNTLRMVSLESGAGVPLYFATDFEGNPSMDLSQDGMLPLPHPMGLTASGEPDLCRKVAAMVGRQLNAVGINWIHSPVLDANTDPNNPEIGTRSYSPYPDTIIEYAKQSLLGFDETNIIATGKHFPGRGHSSEDVHFGIATIGESLERMHSIHLAPYRALIEAGLPAIMLAHSIFPALDPEREIATLSKAIVTGVLREELAYDGVVMTDSFTMGGLVEKYEVGEAAIRSIDAGVDLILLKDENALRGEVYEALLSAVRSGRLTEERIEQSARRVLQAKDHCGLLSGSKGIVDVDQVEVTLADPQQLAVAEEAHQKSVVILRQQDSLLPLKPNDRILVVEEVAGICEVVNSQEAYSGSLYDALLDAGLDADFIDFKQGTKLDPIWPDIERLAETAEVIIHFGYYNRGHTSNKAEHARFRTLGKPTIFVSNDPYGYIVSDDMENVIISFSPMAMAMKAVVNVLNGKRKATARLEFDVTRIY